jgi:protein TonB
MVDRLVESNTTGADLRNRTRYFLVSSIVVGILFLTAIVYSLYATQIGLGSGNFDIAEMLAPVTLEAPEPKASSPQPPSTSESTTPRNLNPNMARPDEHPIAPIVVSSIPNSRPSRSWEPFNPDLPETLGSGSATSRGPGSGTSGSRTGHGNKAEPVEPAERPTEPPPAVRENPKPKPVVSEGVINGKATFLPVPQYSAAAKAVDAEGTVNVQVTIDEQGNVISAKAATGHPLLKPAAEQAARRAKFSPTYLSKIPVKVTGVIVYHFKRD